MADEVLERRWFAVLLTHKKQGDERRQNHSGSSYLELVKADQLAQALSEHSIPDLIVILGTNYELTRITELR